MIDKVKSQNVAVCDENNQILSPSDLHSNIKRTLQRDYSIITAICISMGKSDNCTELAVLRRFRNNSQILKSEWLDLMDQYDQTAPIIAEKLRKFPDWLERSDKLYRDFLMPCIRFIEQKRYHRAVLMYQVMMIYCQDLLEPDILDY